MDSANVAFVDCQRSIRVEINAAHHISSYQFNKPIYVVCTCTRICNLLALDSNVQGSTNVHVVPLKFETKEK